MRPTIIQLLLEGDVADFADYYDPVGKADHPVQWKDLHPGALTISKHVVDTALANHGPLRRTTSISVKPTYPSEAMDDCLKNLSTENVITPTSNNYHQLCRCF